MANNYTLPGVTTLRATSAATLSATFYNDGAAVDPGAVTITITRADGTAVVTGQATTGSGSGARSYTLTADKTQAPDLWAAVWSGTVSGQAATITQHIEIVGDHLFTIAEARAADFHGQKALASTTAYPDAAIAEARTRIAEWFEEVCEVAFFPRYRRVVLDGDGSAELGLPTTLLIGVRALETRPSPSAAWTAVDPASIVADDTGLVSLATGYFPEGRQTVRVGYEYGHLRVPEPIRRAALRLAVSEIVPSNLPDRALSQSTDIGTFRLSVPGERGNWTGIPAVDATLRAYSRRRPGIG